MGFLSGLVDAVSDVFNPKNLVSSAFDLGSKFLGNSLINQSNADRANKAAAASTAMQWDREYGAYKTRYQDTMADMRAAGLNPILASSSGFNVGSGASASVGNTFAAQGQNIDAASSALALSNKDRSEEETSKIKKETDKIVNESKHVLEQIARTRTETGKIAQDAANAVKQYEVLSEELRKVAAQATIEETRAKAFKLLNFPIKGGIEIEKLLNDEALITDILRGITGAAEKAAPFILNFKNEVLRRAEDMKNFLQNGE